MVSVADKMKEINLSDESGIDSSAGDMNAGLSRKEETDTLSDIVTENKGASVKRFEETAGDATIGGVYKTAGNICLYINKSFCLLIFTLELKKCWHSCLLVDLQEDLD